MPGCKDLSVIQMLRTILWFFPLSLNVSTLSLISLLNVLRSVAYKDGPVTSFLENINCPVDICIPSNSWVSCARNGRQKLYITCYVKKSTRENTKIPLIGWVFYKIPQVFKTYQNPLYTSTFCNICGYSGKFQKLTGFLVDVQKLEVF